MTNHRQRLLVVSAPLLLVLLVILLASSSSSVSVHVVAAAFSPYSSSCGAGGGCSSIRRITRRIQRRRPEDDDRITVATTTTTETTSTSSSQLKAQIFVDLVNEYQYLTTTFPLSTQSATFGTFAGIGDALAQKTEQSSNNNNNNASNNIDDENATAAAALSIKSADAKDGNANDDSSFDGKRTQRFVLKGLGAGLIWSKWYPLVDAWSDVLSAYALTQWLAMEDTGTAHTIAKTALSILMEQFIACPIIYSLWDIPVPALLAGIEPSKIPHMVRDKVPGLLLDNAKVWTVANIVVYNLPVQWRVFAVSVAEIFWASIVSSVATSGTSSMAFVEAQDTLIDQITEEKRKKVVETVVSSSGIGTVERE